jgi:hypothetical protein
MAKFFSLLRENLMAEIKPRYFHMLKLAHGGITAVSCHRNIKQVIISDESPFNFGA